MLSYCDPIGVARLEADRTLRSPEGPGGHGQNRSTSTAGVVRYAVHSSELVSRQSPSRAMGESKGRPLPLPLSEDGHHRCRRPARQPGHYRLYYYKGVCAHCPIWVFACPFTLAMGTLERTTNRACAPGLGTQGMHRIHRIRYYHPDYPVYPLRAKPGGAGPVRVLPALGAAAVFAVSQSGRPDRYWTWISWIWNTQRLAGVLGKTRRSGPCSLSTLAIHSPSALRAMMPSLSSSLLISMA